MRLSKEDSLKLRDEVTTAYFIREQGGKASLTTENPGNDVRGMIPSVSPEMLGSAAFRQSYGVKYALYGGAMANGITSVEMVIAMGKAGFMASFGSGGLSVDRVRESIHAIRNGLGDRPFLVNLLNSPFEPKVEEDMVALFLSEGITAIEASAYMTVTRNLVRYRASGLSRAADGSITIQNRIIAKISRKEVAIRFLAPAPDGILSQLVNERLITADQAELAKLVPMADDITVEADSGGHTDHRPLVGLLPSIVAIRDAVQRARGYATPVRIGSAGGIGTPAAAAAAFQMGADYIVTGSINQACRESGASSYTRELLAKADSADMGNAPASDMFEMGVTVQVLKRGTMFVMRAQKLYELYTRYESIDEIPDVEREKIEKTIFKTDLESVWQDCVRFFTERDPSQLERGRKSEKERMALIFRWYLGQASRWSVTGEKGREMDYQIWCGPSMGAFNEWAKGTALEAAENRSVADVALRLLNGAAGILRMTTAELFGVSIAPEVRGYFLPCGLA